jgi:2-methylcitrate dehydratase PrpD
VLAAIAAGYEIGVRVAVGRPGYAPSGAWSPFAVIAAAGCLRGTGAGPLAHALAIAAQCAPSLPGLAGLMGSDVKEGIPWGAATGMTALFLAEAGFTGPLGIFDEPSLFARERIVGGLGGEPLIGGTYFKPYACCRHIHAPLDAYAALAARNALAPAEIASVEVHTYGATFNLSNRAAPRDLVEAQYSVPFCIALLALHGRDALLPMDRECLDDRAARDFAGRVMIHRDAAIDALFPAQSPARVVVNTSRGRFESPVTVPRGDPSTPLSWDELRAKLVAATKRVLAPVRQDELLRALDSLRDGDLVPLRAALGRPLAA